MRTRAPGRGRLFRVSGRGLGRGHGAQAVADNVYQYNGPGFSPIGDKSRFVLPPKLRKTLKDSNGGEKTIYVDRHPVFPCLIGFGEPYKRMLLEEVTAASAQSAERHMLNFQLNSFIDLPFDESGRIIFPRPILEMGGITDAIYFHGAGPYFTMWDPEQLLAMEGSTFMAAQIHCRAHMAAGKGRK